MTSACIVGNDAMSDLYNKFLDMKIILRDVQSHFHTYSATDIKKLIAAKMKSKREPKALQQLERAITDLRLALAQASVLPSHPDQEPPAKPESLLHQSP
jgi:hypothetical protein